MKRNFIIFFLIISSSMFAQLPNKLSNKEKIYGLSKVWSEVKRNFVYYDRIGFNWDSLYVAYIDRVITSKNDYQYYKTLQKMVAKLKDGHTRLWLPDVYYDSILGKPPIKIRLIENKIIIFKVLNKFLLERGLKKGMEIVKINDIEAKKYVQKYIAPYVSASTIQNFNVSLYEHQLLFGLKKEIINLEIKNSEGEIKKYVIDRNLPYNIENKKNTFEFKKIKQNIGLLTINKFWGKDFNQKFDAIFKKLLNTNALIIDIRDNEGGNSQNAEYVLKHLAKNNFYGSAWRTRQYRPAFISWGKSEEWFNEPAKKIKKRKGKRYKKNIIVLISSRTFSSAEDFLVAFKQMNRGRVIGSPTGGSTGNPIEFGLPGGGGMAICSKEDTFKNGDRFVGIGVVPDIEIKETFNDFIENKDRVLEKAIEIIFE